MRGKKMIVLSADALVHEDMAAMKQLPNFQKYLTGGACIERVKSIYPTITYPCHTTMATGCWPDRHGIPGNLKSPYKYITPPVPWIWEHEYVKVPDIFDAAKRAGHTTAGVFWPCTGNHPSIDWLIDEYWTQSKDQTLADAAREMGTQECVIPIIERHAHLMKERTHPFCDDFMIACAADIIREFTPDLIMIHPANIDGARHGHGVFGEHIQKTLEDTDRWIGDLMQAAEEAGVLADTNLVLTSDHGQMDIKRVIHINVLLADAGLIRPKDDGTVEWDAWCQSGGMSACVYLKDPSDHAVYDRTYARTIIPHSATSMSVRSSQARTTETTARAARPTAISPRRVPAPSSTRRVPRSAKTRSSATDGSSTRLRRSRGRWGSRCPAPTASPLWICSQNNKIENRRLPENGLTPVFLYAYLTHRAMNFSNSK